MAVPIRILIIDDDEDEYFLTEDRLAEVGGGFDIRWSATFGEGLVALRSEPFDVCLLDYRLGAHSGIELLQSVRDCDLNTAFILLTGQGDRDVDDAAIAAGAEDYLEKQEITPRLLERTIRHALERRRIRSALEESESHYRLLAETAQELFLIHDLGGRIEYVNTAGLALLGYGSEDEVVGLSVLSLVAPHNRAGIQDRVAGQMAGELARHRYDVEVLRADGAVVPLEVSSSPLVTRGQVRAIFVVGRDITERRAAQAQLLAYSSDLEARVAARTSELQSQIARMRALLESTPDGVVITDPEGDILEMNPVAQRWLGEVLSRDDRAQMKTEIRRLAQQEGVRASASLELTGMDLDLVAIPVLTDYEGPEAVVVYVHDVTHLMAVTRMQRSFVTSISHELRTPLTAIRLYASMMVKRPEAADTYLSALNLGAERLAALVEDVVVIARLDAGRQEFKMGPIDLSRLASYAIDAEQSLAALHNVTLVPPAADAVMTYGDRTTLEQALIELIQNAIHHSPEGGSVIVSTGTAEIQGSAVVWCRVEDRGVGIPAEELPHIFDRFYRGQWALDMQMPGTGLGLAIAKQILLMHGGTISVQSEVGAGTAFTMQLPAWRGAGGNASLASSGSHSR